MKKLLNRSEFVKNSLILIVGIGFAQVIPVLLQPILRRMFEPEDFGVFAVYFSIVSTLAIVANFRYAHVVVIPKEDDESLNVLAGALGLVALFSFLLVVVFFFFGADIIRLADLPEDLNKWMMWIPFGVLFVSSSLVLNGWLNRKKRYKSMATNKIARRVAEGAGHLGFGQAKYAGGIILGTFIGDTVNFLISLFQFRRAAGTFKNVTWQGVKSALKKYIDFPLYNLLPTVLDTVTLFLPVFIISSLYTDEITGQFDLSRQILALPLALISMAIGQVLLQKLSEESNNKKRIKPLIIKNFLALAAMGVLGIIVLYPFSEPIFTFVFGAKWELAGKLTSIMVFSYALRFCITPISILFVAIKKVKISSIWQVGYFLLMCLLFTFDQFSIEEFIFYYMLIELGAYTIYFVLIYFTADRHDRGLGDAQNEIDFNNNDNFAEEQ